MVNLHPRLCVLASILVTLFLPTFLQAIKLPSSRKLSFQLHLQLPPLALNLHNASCLHQPLTPFLFSDQPLFYFDESSLSHINAGRARGVYLADPAASKELRHIFFTATLQKYQGSQLARAEVAEEGSLVLVGSLGTGTVSVAGGTRGFAFASGQAKVSMTPAGSSEQLIILFDVELLSEEEIAFF